MDATGSVITIQKDKPFDGWILKTINPGDECFYVEGGYENGTRTDLTSDATTALFEAPADSVFCKYRSTPYNVNIESVVQWPVGMTSLGNYCFASCSALQSVAIPDSVTSLGNYCFNYCSKFTSITFNGTTEPNFEVDIFNVPVSLVIHVPSNYQGDTFGGCTVTKDLPAV